MDAWTLVFEGWDPAESGIDRAVTNARVARYAALDGWQLDVVLAEEVDSSTLLLAARTRRSQVRVAVAACATLRPAVPADGAGRALRRDPARVTHELRCVVSAGEPVAVEKVVALVTGRDVAVSEPAVAAAEILAGTGGFEELLVGHELAWLQLWRRFRLDLTRHPTALAADTLRTLQLCTFHGLQAVSAHDEDLDAGVPARGLHGEACRVHVFWDELFVFPMQTLRTPEVTRSLLRYRVRRLDAARRAARGAGHRGAMYPWQSGSDGREESQRRHLNLHSGHWLPDTSHLQRHVGLTVAYSIWRYYQATGDREFLADHGAEVLLEVARFFADLARHDPVTDRFHIRGVMGPDEHATRYPGSDRPGIDGQRLHQRHDGVSAAPRRGRARRTGTDPAHRARRVPRPGPHGAIALGRWCSGSGSPAPSHSESRACGRPPPRCWCSGLPPARPRAHASLPYIRLR